MIDIDFLPLLQNEPFCAFLGVDVGTPIVFELLGHGEYNLNYRFCNPATSQMLVLRIPIGSQMHLTRQARYEFEALKLLKGTGRTPQALYLDESRASLPYDFMLIHFLPGRALRYESDLTVAAQCLAQIHNMEVHGSNRLVCPKNPLEAMLRECKEMFAHYNNCAAADPKSRAQIARLLKQGEETLAHAQSHLQVRRCIINTELNSGNFLVNENGPAYLIDWEKPLYAYPGQDLGHFLAPTTTFWKTDTILCAEQINAFLQSYCAYSAQNLCADSLWEHAHPYFAMTLLRGITWCAMAWVEYQQEGRLLKDAFTYEKIKTYLSKIFLERIEEDYLYG